MSAYTVTTKGESVSTRNQSMPETLKGTPAQVYIPFMLTGGGKLDVQITFNTETGTLKATRARFHVKMKDNTGTYLDVTGWANISDTGRWVN